MTGRMSEPVAIVGMDVLLPGAASLDDYWHNLTHGVDAIGDVPPNRWDPQHYDPPQASQPNRLYCRRGGFVDDLAWFDPVKYGVMPASVPETEPEQLLALRVAAAAIEDAGGVERLGNRDKVGVILGRLGQSSMTSIKFYLRVMLADMTCGYMRELVPDLPADQLERVREKITERLGSYHPENVIGLMPNLTASRVANRLNLRGPAFILDAACASSLVAVDHGIAGLLSGRLDAVVAGGVHHNHDVTFWAVFNQLRALSRSEQIRPFDAAADGLLIGEGTGAVVLKRLSDAVRDGNRIHAVIRGIGVSSDGRSASLVNPEQAGQVLAVRRAWACAGLDPAEPGSVGMVEAHGTGTPVGDGVELSTLAEVFGPPDGRRAPVIGSVKSMIGHAMPAAGVAALVKAALAVSRGQLLPTLHCDNPRPEMAATRFRPIAKAEDWDGPGPRRAAVNAFGFGGINVHAIVEQAPEPPRPSRRSRATGPALPGELDPAAQGPASEEPAPLDADRPDSSRLDTAQLDVAEPDRIVLLAGQDAAAIARLLDASDDEIRAHGLAAAGPGAASTGAAGTGAAGPGASGSRLGLVGPTAARLDAARKIVAAGAPWRGGRDIWFSPQPMLAGGRGQVAFVFPGLEAELTHSADDVARHFGLPALAADPADFTGRFAAVMELGALLHEALGRTGVRPDAVAGHSLGEWTASLVTGLAGNTRLGGQAALLFHPAWERKDLQHAVIGDSAEAVAGVLERYPGVVLTHDNSPTQAVVCGPVAEVARLIEDLGQRSVLCRPLPFTTGIHTPYVAPLVEQLRIVMDEPPASAGDAGQADAAATRANTATVWSATTAAPAPDDEAGQRELFYRQLAEPVRFRETLLAMHAAGVRAFLQVGPGQLAALIGDSLRGLDHLAIPVNVDFRDGMAQLRRVATALWVEGYAPDFAALTPAAKPEPAAAQPITPPRAKRSLAMRIDLGTERVSLGDGADKLLGLNDLLLANGSHPPTPPSAAASPAVAPPAATTPAATVPVVTLPSVPVPAPAPAAAPAVAPPMAASVTFPPPATTTSPPAPPGSAAAPSYWSVLPVSLTEMPYLLDHCFNPVPENWPHARDRNAVVPATTIIQHMVDAVLAAAPGVRVVRVEDATFRSWVLAVPPVDVYLTVKPTGPGEFAVTFGPFAMATIRTAPDWPAAPQRWAMDPASERPSPLSVADMYAQRVMFHGPAYRGVVEVQAIGDRHVRGLLRAPAPPGAALDSALQLIGNWTHVSLADRKVMFPTGFGAIDFFGPVPAAGEPMDCVVRIHTVADRQIIGDIQVLHQGRVWAQITNCITRRFDSHPRSRAAETDPGHHAFAVQQPEGWVAAFDYWPDPASQNSIVSLVFGAEGYGEYEAQPVVTRKGWLLSRLAVKDAVRYQLWDKDAARPVFPIEITATGPANRPGVTGWSGLDLPAVQISAAYARNLGVAIARPTPAGADAGAPGLGVGVQEIPVPPAPGERPRPVLPPAPLAVLSEPEQDLLTWLAGADSGQEHAVWAARFAAARQAAAAAAGQDEPDATGPLITAATGDTVTVTTRGCTWLVRYRELANPGELPARSYAVAWTSGPQPAGQ